jgi:hypothetical protein
VLDATVGRPYGLLVHGNDDVTGAVNGVTRIVTGLGWRQVSDVVAAVGAPTRADTDACWELGAVLGASLLD